MKRPLCPCHSGLALAVCCGPLHRGEKEAETPVALMRSRYAAFAVANVDYLWRTLHVEHSDRALDRAEVLSSLRRVCRAARHPGLTVLDADGPDGDGNARVLFRARVFVGRVDRTFVECSVFRHDGVGWRYVSGELDDDSRVLQGVSTLAAFAARRR